MQRIDGNTLAQDIARQVKEDIRTAGIKPKLSVLLVGDDPASHTYVNLKEKRCADVGIATDIRRLPASTPDEELRGIVEAWNADESVDAILIQLPLPEGHDPNAVIASMDPRKDVDGFHPANSTALLEGAATHFPPVHESVLRLIAATGKDMRGARAAIIANSEIFSAPLGRLLERAGCFVTETTPKDLDTAAIKDASIIVIAVGRPKFLSRDLITSNAVVIDVGTNRLETGKLVGDVDIENTEDIPGWISPVPGGVGPMTIALLLKNVVLLAKKRRGIA